MTCLRSICSTPRLFSLLLSLCCLLLAASIVLAQNQGSWLSARDCGASGSQFQTGATTVAGSKQITVQDPGDFQVGQGVMVSRCNIHSSHSSLWGPRNQYSSSAPLKDLVEMRGYDGSQGSWMVYILDIAPGPQPAFRWTDDLGRTWQGAGTKITYDWQPLAKGVEVRFKQFVWSDGYSVVMSYRDQLVTTIEKIEGKVLTLKDAANRSANDAIIRHNDGLALQAGIDQALKEKRNLFVPPGTYRIASPLRVTNAEALTIEGVNPVDTVLDISEGEGACIILREGTEVNLRNLGFVGHTGFKDRDQCGGLSTQGGTALWGFYFKFCAALNISNTERVLVENCHARRMSGECFYSAGRARSGLKEPAHYTKAITYSRCSVEDCGRNAFNNNDMAENTSVLYCRVRDVGGCTWEGASRFVRFIGNYVRNGGTVAMGNIRSRDASYEILASGQHIIADNVFEEGTCYGGCAIRASAGANQVIIRNNLFINYGTSAVSISGSTGTRDLPAETATITGNIFDMTSMGQYDLNRFAIEATASNVSISDNQVYVRGAANPKVTAIRLAEPALNVTVDNNLISNCGSGLTTARARATVNAIVDGQTFVANPGGVPFEKRQSHRYRGWNVVWLQGNTATGQSVIDAFDPETIRFKLVAARETKVGEQFELYPATGANWDIHHNTFTGCLKPVTLDAYGSSTSLFRNNTLNRGMTTGVTQALAVSGLFKLTGNTFSGFKETGAAALALFPDRFGQPCRNLYRNNIFDKCANVLTESQKGLWEAATSDGNLAFDCGTGPKGISAITLPPPAPFKPVAAPSKPTLRAPLLTKPITLDGDLKEWPLTDKSRVVILEQTPGGDAFMGPKSYAIAACDKKYLYVALRVTTGPAYKLVPATSAYNGEGMEVSFRSGEAKAPAGVLMLYGSSNGSFWTHPAGGATGAQITQLEKETKYATRIGTDEWTAEWKIPLSVLGSDFAKVKKLQCNIGIYHKSDETWLAWIGTGDVIYRVEGAGEITLGR